MNNGDSMDVDLAFGTNTTIEEILEMVSTQFKQKKKHAKKTTREKKKLQLKAFFTTVLATVVLAASDLAINKTKLFSESLTVEQARSEEEVAKFGVAHRRIHCQVHSGLCSIASMIMPSSHCVGSMMIPLSSYTASYSKSLILILALPVRKNRIHC